MLSLPLHRLVAAAALTAAACARPAPGPERAPLPPAEAAGYSALPDTVVCVVDRNTARGLRPLQAKRGADGQVLLRVGAEVLPLDRVHPVSLMAGYAGREPWYLSEAPISLDGRRYVRVQGERKIPLERLHQYEEMNAIPVFADPSDEPPPEAVYLPVRPGCVFQAYVREDLMGDG